MEKNAPKILIVCDSLPGGGYNSGVVVTIIQLMAAIKEKFGHYPMLLGPKPIENGHEGFWLPSVRLTRGYRLAVPFWEMKRAIAWSDIVHLNGFSPLTYFALVEAKKQGKQVIFHTHTQHWHYLSCWFGLTCGGFLARLVDRFYVQCLKKADLVLAPGEFFTEMLKNRYGHADKIQSWKCPINLPQITVEDEIEARKILSEHNVPMNAVKACFVGRIASEKNIAFLLAIWARLSKFNAKIPLVLIGGGEIEKFKKMAIEQGCDMNLVFFLGDYPWKMAVTIAKMMDIAISASESEALGLALLEQMGFGQPALGVAETITGFHARHGGFDLFLWSENPAGAVEIWCDNIIHFAEADQFRKELGHRAAAYVQQNYSKETQFRLLVEIYTQMAGS